MKRADKNVYLCLITVAKTSVCEVESFYRCVGMSKSLKIYKVPAGLNWVYSYLTAIEYSCTFYRVVIFC